ncbi:hypothetical protein CLV31_110101 [Algoriphagus aquaeductus]|uniref:Uncharacterized protein n=1 Tax=Algoriphagus aquaeductus TaxID=475299 RepID=A0A326RN74_9BACT|nr:hypothetical protein CLV31_110101 [Algoriphagus aquaeductus]
MTPVGVKLLNSRGLVGERSRTPTRGIHGSIGNGFPDPNGVELCFPRLHLSSSTPFGVSKTKKQCSFFPRFHLGFRHGGQVIQKFDHYVVIGLNSLLSVECSFD